MKVKYLLLIIDIIIINISFLLSYFIRFNVEIPPQSIQPFKENYWLLTLIYLCVLSFFGVYKKRFKSIWRLFKSIFNSLFLGTLICVSVVYFFRAKWGSFPTSIFIISFWINLIFIFILHTLILKKYRKIKKRVVVLGRGNLEGFLSKDTEVKRIENLQKIEEILEDKDIDEVIICEDVLSKKEWEILLYLIKNLRIDINFHPSIYQNLLLKKINGKEEPVFLKTFIGEKGEIEEFLIRTLDVLGALVLLFLLLPLVLLISFAIKISSPGPVFYKQKRIGKDGKIFTLYKFRTMIKDAEKIAGLLPAVENDPRVTKVGEVLRKLRLDEIPQLFNVLKGNMSLVGPRPENLYRVYMHRALQGIRLAVKPGLTGLAQIRAAYDLKPHHKLKYDYLYIQRRSLLLNFYIIIKTIPAILFSKKGW